MLHPKKKKGGGGGAGCDDCVEKGRSLKDQVTPPKKINFSNYLLTAMLVGSQVKSQSPQNISGASQHDWEL